MNTNIGSLYEFTLQQMAAESYFEGINLSVNEAVKTQLRLGTNRLGYPRGAGEGNTALNGACGKFDVDGSAVDQRDWQR